MLSIQQKSKPAKTPYVLVGMLLALLTVVAVRPVAALAMPPEPVEPPQLAIEPGSYDFGLQPLNWGSRETWFQLRNVGTEGLQVGSPEIVGSGQEAFSADFGPCYGSYLNPGESCSVRVYFGPHDAVEYSAQFKVSVGSYSFAADLSGTGGQASFEPSSNPVDFGAARVGSGVTREIQVTNTGNMPGGVFIAVIAGGAIGSFQILDESCTMVELLPAVTCMLQVSFQPVSEGVKKATLGLFGDNDGPTPIFLTGVGAAPASTSDLPPEADLDAPTAGATRRQAHKRGKRRHRRRNGRAALYDARISSRPKGG